MKRAFGLLLALVGAGVSGFQDSAAAVVQFTQREVDQSRLIAIAAPVGTRAHQLLILEQINDRRPCWRESGSNPAQVDPLLLNFDFTGICGRSVDSNGYSLRVAGQDLGVQYSLRVVRQDNDLVLMAVPARDRTPPLEIGRTNGVASGFSRIQLNPGWRMTKRVYNNQTLPHIYLTHNQTLPTLIAAASSQTGPVPSPVTPAPSRPSLPPARPTEELPVVTIPPTPTTPPVTNRPPTPPLPTVPIPTTPGSSATTAYRVVVQADTPEQQNRVRAIAPGAFRTTINGRAAMQAGLFRDRATAMNLQDQFRQENLQTTLLTVENLATLPQPGPSPQSPVIPNPAPVNPKEQKLVVIDPGHGGSDPGAIGIGGLRETDVVLPISQQVAQLLRAQGISVVLTRQDERTLELAPRVALADRSDADIFVSIHANAATSNANGVETYYYASQEGRELAEAIQSNLVRATGMTNRGVRQARFYVLTQTSMPASLVEVGFVTGQQDARRLRDPAARSQIAGAIAQGIVQYIQQSR